MKRLRADDSGRTSVKVGHRQALIPQSPAGSRRGFVFGRGQPEWLAKARPNRSALQVVNQAASRANAECAQITTTVGRGALCGKIDRVNSLERYRE